MPNRTRPRHACAAVLICATLALAGCGAGAGGGTSSTADRAAAPEAARGDADTGSAYGPESARGAGGAKGAAPAAAQQHIIRTAELSVEVADAGEALARARDAAAKAGGHVADESTRRRQGPDGGDGMTSRIVLRVPQAAYEQVLGELGGAGRLLSRKAEAKDVTDQVVDVGSRVATQRASVERVRKLMDQATRLSDVVTLEQELSTRQAALESLLAQQAALKDRTALATITLELSERRTPQKPAEKDDPGPLDALAGGWDALAATAKWVVIVLAALAPWLAVAALLYVLWRVFGRPWRARRAARRPAPAAAAWPVPGRGPVPAYAPAHAPVPAQAPAPAAASGPDTGSGTGTQGAPDAGRDAGTADARSTDAGQPGTGRGADAGTGADATSTDAGRPGTGRGAD
ncbi:DUF4349 domain-containing protein [Streptomyces kanasensis]|uniref:DUF4349 domain-containing protein n=1 Tax=Streptomyces kanasensis TaxID=936756 RepID=UPI0036FE0907